jgi:hypothetical protein
MNSVLRRNIEWKLRTVGNSIFLSNSIKVFQVNFITAKIAQLSSGNMGREEIIHAVLGLCHAESIPENAPAEMSYAVDQLIELGIIKEELC